MPRKQVVEAKAMTTRRQRRVRFPCIICDRACDVDTIHVICACAGYSPHPPTPSDMRRMIDLSQAVYKHRRWSLAARPFEVASPAVFYSIPWEWLPCGAWLFILWLVNVSKIINI